MSDINVATAASLRDEIAQLKEQLKAAQQRGDELQERIYDLDSDEPWPYYNMHVLDEDGSDDMHDSIRGREVDAFLREKVGIWGVTAESPFIFYDIYGQDNQKAHNKCASLGAGFDIYGTAVEMWCWDGVEELAL